MIDQATRIAIERDAERIAKMLGVDEMPSRQCLRWATATCMALSKAGFASCINAGSAGFRVVAEEHDLGGINQIEFRVDTSLKIDDLFGYYEREELPEMHAWAVVPSQSLIVDMTVRFREQWAQEMGVKFSMPPMHSLWWHIGGEAPHGCWYHPNVLIGEFAMASAGRLLRNLNLRVLESN